MKKYSVVIPTANRPHYLETALSSVSRQTVVNEIEEILVSENLGCRESEIVCAKFLDLPIRYIFREPQLSNVEHIQALYLEAKAPLIAMLCDDDWWSPTHLYMAGRALDNCPSASSWFSGFLYSASESERYNIYIHLPMVFWVGAGYPDVTKQWRLNFENTIVVCWLVTPFHFSAMVARRDALQKATSFMNDAHPYYADRILYPGLALQGDILFEPFFDTYARSHSGNWIKDKKQEELLSSYREGCEKIRDIGQENGYDPALIWRSLSKSLAKDIRMEVASSFQYALDESQMRQLGFSSFVAVPASPKIIRASRKAIRGVRRLVKELSKVGF